MCNLRRAEQVALNTSSFSILNQFYAFISIIERVWKDNDPKSQSRKCVAHKITVEQCVVCQTIDMKLLNDFVTLLGCRFKETFVISTCIFLVIAAYLRKFRILYILRFIFFSSSCCVYIGCPIYLLTITTFNIETLFNSSTKHFHIHRDSYIVSYFMHKTYNIIYVVYFLIL